MKVSKQSKVMLLAAGLALLAPSAMKAQQPESRSAEVAAFHATSQQIQAEVAAITRDRSAAAHDLIARWEAVLDPNGYDLRQELTGMLSRTSPWQLYAASLAPDFQTMLGIIRGRVSASGMVNSTFGMKSVDVYAAELLGEPTNELVYTPIAPCRVVDTRTPGGARTGALGPATSRTFDLTTTGFAKGQGGAAACAGLPSFSHLGWAVNITVTGQTGNGWLTVYPSLGTLPGASTINYSVGQWSLANGVNLTGCFGCGDDIVVAAEVSATHVIIDVVGFFSEATGPAAAVTRVAAPFTTSTAGTRAFFDGGDCPGGTVLIGGEVDHGGQDLVIGEQRQDTGFQRWTAWMVNNDAFSSSVSVISVCYDNPVVLQ